MKKCRKCKGKGIIIKLTCTKCNYTKRCEIKCPNVQCPTCKGTGKVEEEK